MAVVVYERPAVVGRCRLDPDLGPAGTQAHPDLDHLGVGETWIEVRLSLRPGRPEVRVEAGTTDDGRPLVHNYGHGGAGFILSWGCALDVVGMTGSPQAPSPW